MSVKCKIFVVFHKELNLEYYREEILDHYVFVNVNPNNDVTLFPSTVTIINLYEFNNFFPLGKWYTESEVIYNVYKNSYLYEDLDFIGFSQYDIDTSKLTKASLDSTLTEFNHINFQPHLFETDYARGVVMDVKRPNRINGKGLNCYDAMLKEYNDFYQSNYKIADLNGKTINVCSAFVFSTVIFKEMMAFIAPIIESKKLDVFDAKHTNRMQGGYLERYYALWLALNNNKTKVIELDHHFIESVKGNTLANKIMNKLRKWF
jgi:hypothetical protein